MAKAALMLSVATLVSRFLGLLREQVFAALLGAGFYGDAFTMAFRLPNLLRDLFAEGALSAAFQPAFIELRKKSGPQAAFLLANAVTTLLLIVVGTLVLLGVLLAPQLVDTWAAGYAQVAGKAELTILLTRIMMPFLLLVSVASVAMGMLNAEQRFVPPALAPALFNLAAIVVGGSLWLLGIGQTRTAAIAWAAATMLGGVLQLLAQWLPLFRSGYRPRLTSVLAHQGLRAVLWAMAPATIGLGATQLNIYISSSFASQQDGAVTWLQVAFRLMQLPIGMFGVAVGTVALAQAAESASESDLRTALDGVRDTLRRGLRLTTFYTLPTAVALWVLSEPILRVIYQHGAFSAFDTEKAAAALRYYSLGLLCYSGIKVFAPVFYALKRTRIPMLASLLGVLCGVLWNIVLHRHYGYLALALGTTITASVNFAVLLVSFRRMYGDLLREGDGKALLQIALLSAVSGVAMSATVWAYKTATGTSTLATSTAGGLALVVAALLVGGSLYVGLGRLAKLGEVQAVLAVLSRRLPRRG
jgi:putative peptidoglycan lipid II flippase